MVCYRDILEISANWAAILTAAVAVLAYGGFLLKRSSRRQKLEGYLREQLLVDHDRGKRSITHLMAHLAMTEAEVLQAGFESKRIESSPGSDAEGYANRIYFQYVGKDVPAPQKF
jgi:hypothetical protein